MHAYASSSQDRPSPLWGLLILTIATGIAVLSAQRTAGSWYDGSRLATVESLVDYHTLAIDDSIFVRVPQPEDLHAPGPYPADEPGLRQSGTGDKLWIDGHFYSDKSPVPALFMAGLYQALQWITGWTARARPDQFCYWLTLGSSGLAYVLTVWCVYGFGAPFQLALSLRLLLTASAAVATVALPYARQVNNHILLLAVAAGLVLQLGWLAHDAAAGRVARWRLAALGMLAGLGYAIDLAAGPALLVCTLPVVAYRCRSVVAAGTAFLAALPWLVLHHAVNYAVGGTLKPANAVVEYFQWPGCSFDAANLTGLWHHDSVLRFLLYGGDLLVGKNGFLGHNLALFLALAGMAWLLWRGSPAWPEVLFALCWCGGTWLAYALSSTNHAGQCCSIRWFVPLLAPCYYVLALLLRSAPELRWDLLTLSGWGTVVGILTWQRGPWMKRMVPGYWLLFAAGLLSWLLCWRLRRQSRKPAPVLLRRPEETAAAA